MTSPRKVSYPSNSLTIAGHLYTPAAGAPNRHRAAIIISHPMTGVKEQTAGVHAAKLAEQGFITLAFDAAYQGESEGTPRYMENPFQRSEDVRAGVSFLSTLPEVDPGRIGAIGICASGGYVPYAAQTDKRIRAVATISAICTGGMTREGIKPKGAVTPKKLEENLEQAGKWRTEEAKGEQPVVGDILPDVNNIPEELPDLFKEGSVYYKTNRGMHPRSIGKWLLRCADMLANYDSFAFNHMISPRPLLMIVGSKADTAYFST
jgi:uncharacterized protein